MTSMQTDSFLGLHVQTWFKQAWYHHTYERSKEITVNGSWYRCWRFDLFYCLDTMFHTVAPLHWQHNWSHADVLYEDHHVTGPSLLGRNWLHTIRLNWNCILKVEASHSDFPDSIDQKLQATIQRHPNVFKPGLGTMRRIAAKLELKEDARPKFC